MLRRRDFSSLVEPAPELFESVPPLFEIFVVSHFVRLTYLRLFRLERPNLSAECGLREAEVVGAIPTNELVKVVVKPSGVLSLAAQPTVAGETGHA